jgi:nodulation protein E
MKRVVVTGLGVVSALGNTRAKHFEGLRNGRCGIGPLDIPDVERLSVIIGGAARAFRGEDYFTKSELGFYDRTTQLALVAAREAVEESGIVFDGALGLRTGVVMGTALNGMETIDSAYRAVFEEGKNRIHPFIVPRLMTSAGASHISMTYGVKGPAWTVTTACSSSNHAIGQAFQLIRDGSIDVAIAGGAEAPLFFGVIKAWEGLRVLSRDGCRPFCSTRNGMVQGEGAAIVILEELERARARGARIWGEIAGFGMTADAADIVQPSVDGAARAMTAALEDARLAPADIGYINAHGTATLANDRTECAAIRAAFGPDAERTAISSTKSMHGHCIGGAGAIELAAVLMALNEDILPPTIGMVSQDPECDLDIIAGAAREARIDAALSNSFAFGGLNAVLAVRRV